MWHRNYTSQKTLFRPQLARPAFLLFLVFILFGFVPASTAQWTPMNPVVAVQQQPDGATFTMKSGSLRLQLCSASILRVLYSPTSSFAALRPDPVIIKSTWPLAK